MKKEMNMDLFEIEQQLENHYVMHTYARKPVNFVRGEGMYLYDDKGKSYLDFLSGIGCISVGHCNPAVSAALARQASRLVHVGNYFYVEGRGVLAEKLNTLLSAPGTARDTCKHAWKTFFANSGAEANEGAIKLARKHGKLKLNGAATIVSAQKSFHGRTLAALAATGQESKQAVFTPMPAGFVHTPLNDIEALKHVLDAQDAAAHLAGDERAGVMDASTKPEGGSNEASVCAILLECIQGEAGIWPCTMEYLKAVRELTAERGILLIIDEIQTGFFRTGTYPFSFQHYGIIPDVVTMAKGIANGVPMGAFAAYGELGDLLQPGEHGSTFGGSLLAIAAANATIDEMLDMDVANKVAATGAYFAAGLAHLPKVSDIRGLGLMRGVTLTEPIAAAVGEAALEKGLVLNVIGDSVLRFLPPLIATTEHVDEALGILKESLMWSPA